MATNAEQSSNLRAIFLNLFWLDANIHNNDNKIARNRLNENFGRCRFIDNMDKAKKATDMFFGDKYVFVVSGAYANELLEYIHDKDKLESVYIYCMSVQIHQQLQQKYKKVNLGKNFSRFFFSKR